MPTFTRNLRHGTMTLKDGQTAANTLVIACEAGDLEFTEQVPGVIVKHRGALDHWSKGEEMEVPVSFSVHFSEYVSKTTKAIVPADAGGAVTDISVRDFLTGKDGGTLLTSSSGRDDVYTCTLSFAIVNPATTGDEAETLVFTKFRAESIVFSEGADVNTLRVSGRALVAAPAGTRS